MKSATILYVEEIMKKISKILAGMLCVMAVSMGAVMAEPTFTPLNFDDSAAVKPATTTTTSATPKGTDLLAPNQVVAGTKMQDSILKIDNAQTELRNKLLNYKTQYAEVDSRYQATKTERKAAKKQVKYAEKKIKNLDNAKKKIRKNFQRNMNI